MRYYQARARTFQTHQGREPVFPNEVELSFTFHPLQPFGMTADGGSTAVTKASLSITTDMNAGRYDVTSKPSLMPLFWEAVCDGGRVECRGNQLRVFCKCANIDQLEDEIVRLYYGLPPLLSVEFADPVFVTHVHGWIGDLVFTWAYEEAASKVDATTQTLQEEKLAKAWRRLSILQSTANRRLFAALNFYYVAARLRAAGYTPWEFMGEVILNLSKCLEVLFQGGDNSHDAIRAKLKELKYSSDEIERAFIPALKLRNLLGSGHVQLAELSSQQLRVVHEYSDHAVANFRELMNRLVQLGEENPSLYPPYEAKDADTRLLRLLEHLATHFPVKPTPNRFSGSITLRGPFGNTP